MALTKEQIERYSRHIVLKEIGVEGQEKLLHAKVFVIGVGGLGSPVVMYLAAAGVGTIGIADADAVDLSNLQRQIIHTTKDAGIPKVQSAKETIAAMNPDITVKTYHTFVTSENIMELIQDYDFIIDATDNFSAKFLINDACVMAKKPLPAKILDGYLQVLQIVFGKVVLVSSLAVDRSLCKWLGVTLVVNLYHRCILWHRAVTLLDYLVLNT